MSNESRDSLSSKVYYRLNVSLTLERGSLVDGVIVDKYIYLRGIIVSLRLTTVDGVMVIHPLSHQLWLVIERLWGASKGHNDETFQTGFTG